MIRLNADSDGVTLRIEQRDDSPSVYFDHWALRTFSEDRTLGTRFINLLKEKGGTLCLSWLNFAEFSHVYPDQQIAAEEFINALLPNIAFIEIAPFVVIESEDRLLRGVRGPSPHLDTAFAKILVNSDGSSLETLSAHNLFRYSSSPELQEKYQSYTSAVMERTEIMRKEAAADPSIAKRIRNFIFRQPVGRGTRNLIREVARSLVLNHQMKMTANHAMDLTHTVVPVCYCEFVLLDAHWLSQVEQAQKRMKRDGVLRFPLAKVYSNKKGEIERFLEELTAFEKLPDTT